MQVLDAVDLEERLRTVLPLLTRQIEALKLLQKSRVLGPAQGRRGGASPGPIGPDGGDEDEDGDDAAALERKVRGAGMSEAALKVCLKELRRCVRAGAGPEADLGAALTFCCSG